MSELQDWSRPQWAPGGGDALVYYQLFGAVPADLAVDGETYRCAGVPPGLALDEYDRETVPVAFELIDAPVIRERLDELGEDLAQQIRSAPQCLLLHGEVRDPSDLGYLRDVVGLCQFLLDNGSVALLDVQTMRWYSPETWREDVFGPDAALPGRHVLTLFSQDERNADRLWVHTRGMRKFGRPDVSVRNVTEERREIAFDLCSRLIESQAFGALVEDGREVVLDGLPSGMRLKRGGDMDDPDFNNVHLEAVLPDRP